MGCPNQCIFCNQRSISGCKGFSEEDVICTIETALSTISDEDEAEIAFFGGSFTGIDRDLMLRLLQTAQHYVDERRVQSIRLSTRPDYIDEEILSLLSRYSVRHIELGLQSMSDRVLTATRRGHSAKQAQDACRAVVDAGFSLVGQMMIGLPESSPEDEVDTAKQICALGAVASRIYPTVVFYETPLCEMMQEGNYVPLSIEEAVERSAMALRVFREHQIPCIRIGLCATEDLLSDASVCAGPNHSALGELVLNRYYYDVLIERLVRSGLLGRDVVLTIPQREMSKVIGQRRSNLVRLLRDTDTRVQKVIGEETGSEIRIEPWRDLSNTGRRKSRVSEIIGDAGV